MNVDYKCRECKRFITESNCREGWARMKCAHCGAWQIVRYTGKVTVQAPDHLRAAGI